MARGFGHITEVIRRGHDADAEVVHPEAVNQDAGRERIGAAGDGQGEFAAAATFVEREAVRAGEHFEELTRGDRSALITIAADIHVAVARFLDVGDHHRRAGAAGVRDVERVDVGELEVLRGHVIVDEGRGNRLLPALAEVAARGRALEQRDGGDILDIGQGPGEGGELSDGGVILVALATGLAAQLDMRDDLIAVLLEHRLVGEGDFLKGLRLEAAESVGDKRVDRVLLISQGGFDDGGSLLLEILRADLLEADKRTGDRVLGAVHRTSEGGAQLTAVAQVELLQDIEACGAAETAGQGGEGARSELAMEGSLHARKVLIVATGSGINQLGELLLVVGPISVGRRVLADEKRITDDRVLLRLDDGGEDAVEGVVVGGRDRVELVIMATRAGHGQPEEALGRRIDALVDGVVIVLETLPDGDEAEGREARIILGQVRQAVGGELLDDELVVRLIGVESVDDVVSIGPGGVEGLDRAVTLQALGVGVAGGIEPVASPALAVVGRSEQTVDGTLDDGGHRAASLPLAGGHVVHGEGGVVIAGEGVDLDARRRQADQVIGKTAEQRFAVRGGAGLEALLIELREQESVDFVLAPGGVAELGRHGEFADRLEGPVAARLVGKTGELGAAGTGGSRRAHLDPLLKRRDLRGGKLGALLARRHRKIGIRLMDGKDQHGFLDIARHDRRT